MDSSKVWQADRLAGNDSSVWVTITDMVRKTGAINLGQGFSDSPPPQYLCDALSKVLQSGNYMFNQYTRMYGHPRLVQSIAKMYSKLHQRELDPMSEIVVTAGAYESLFSCFQGLVNPGEEVIIIEPFFDCYVPMTRIAGGTPVFVPLRPDGTEVKTSADWKLDPAELESKFSNKTKLLILNTPNNPLGKVYTKDELTVIANLCIKYDVVCVADEVYAWMVYPGSQHIRIATLPGMWDRTITVSSAGKMFNATGWRLGWSVGPKHLIKSLMIAHQKAVGTCCTPIQEAVAEVIDVEIDRLEQNPEQSYLNILPNVELLPKRNKMVDVLKAAGLTPVIPEAGYFIVADWTKLGVDNTTFNDDSEDPIDYKFVKWLIMNRHLVVIPVSTFYGPEHKHLAENYIRICFFKADATLDAACQVLKSFQSNAQT